jgi:hypothetical protein
MELFSVGPAVPAVRLVTGHRQAAEPVGAGGGGVCGKVGDWEGVRARPPAGRRARVLV